ncbi:AP-5 complex subunit beta-1 [Cucumis melo var. makuwa]|uniref:AP-5 complex subunit beta-1 n=1 Tax=Cucumis melo var. makuwa TaxID=1194695 RepID=A0A5D3BDX5_CUCMM|nr:AP-5 complex subunit beta-1 [Cucumis melo var. makuwa]TYJ97204.1 AP-5 complex subunit beta-1 [Cucumis melo var. makuwa]
MTDHTSDNSKPPLKSLPLQDWESLIEDFHSGGPRLHRWSSQFSITASSLIDLVLSSILKRDFPLNLKLQLLHFIDEFVSFSDFPDSSDSVLSESILERLVETLRVILQSPNSDGLFTFSLKEQIMVSTTSIFISVDALRNFDVRLHESLTELLLTVVNRPNHGIDRQARAIACECLRELEKAYPCLLSHVVGHLWSLCQSERTHSSQSYILLFTTVISNIVAQRSSVSILSTSIPLVPFNVPQSVLAPDSSSIREVSAGLNSKELRRAIAFLLESPQILTPPAMVEFMAMIMPVASALELQASMLKVQFFGMIYSFDPLLCHVVLMMYLHFLDAFDEQEREIARRLLSISKETQQHLVFRLLALHWLLGLFRIDSSLGKKINSVAEMGLSFYPAVFDPLALKALKLDLLAFTSIRSTVHKAETVSGEDSESGKSVVKLLQDGLVCVSAFKWLPSGSTETAVAFRAFHKFLIGSSSHSVSDSNTIKSLVDSNIFHMLQEMLVESILESQRLVPVIVAFADRLLGCQKHRWLGENLLQKFDEHLLPKVAINYQLVSCFSVFNRMAENDTIPPSGLLGLFAKFMLFLVEKHGPDTGIKSWSLGSKVLGICRTLLMHHQSSRLFLKMSHLLAFTCLYFPDLEVRDNARIYLRMLTCVPGKKLRDLLKLGDQPFGISQTLHSGALYNVQSPRLSHDLKKCRNISSYIHLRRKIPLLVKHSWSLSLSTLGVENDKSGFPEGIMDTETVVEERVTELSSNIEKINLPQEPLRVMDSKISRILDILRRHFSCIPDYRHMPGLKVTIFCSLSFDSEPFNRIWGSDTFAKKLDDMGNHPAMYATVLKFSSSASFGPIPSRHIPFILGESPGDEDTGSRGVSSLDIVPIQNGYGKEERFKALVAVELEPREPTPGFVDVSIESTAGSGQIIRGPLESITVGLEDLFLKAVVPSDVSMDEIPGYYSDLFNALWEACGTSSSTGRETFSLKGGKGVAAIGGTRSVKLLEVSVASLIEAAELYLAPFIVSVVGEQLIQIVKDRNIIKNVIWEDMASENFSQAPSSVPDLDRGPLRLTYFSNEDEMGSLVSSYKRNMGHFHILIFLPPRFHLLFQMEVSDFSTLVRIRTDHWPCLAYVDDYLEALFLA